MSLLESVLRAPRGWRPGPVPLPERPRVTLPGAVTVSGALPVNASAVLNTAAFFSERRNRADFAAFDRLMRRKGGDKPRRGDER